MLHGMALPSGVDLPGAARPRGVRRRRRASPTGRWATDRDRGRGPGRAAPAGHLRRLSCLHLGQRPPLRRRLASSASTSRAAWPTRWCGRSTGSWRSPAWRRCRPRSCPTPWPPPTTRCGSPSHPPAARSACSGPAASGPTSCSSPGSSIPGLRLVAVVRSESTGERVRALGVDVVVGLDGRGQDGASRSSARSTSPSTSAALPPRRRSGSGCCGAGAAWCSGRSSTSRSSSAPPRPRSSCASSGWWAPTTPPSTICAPSPGSPPTAGSTCPARSAW